MDGLIFVFVSLPLGDDEINTGSGGFAPQIVKKPYVRSTLKKYLVPLALGGLGIGTTEFVMMGLLPDIARNFHISIPAAGHLISAYAAGVVIGAPLLVAFSGSFAPKKILLALMGLFTLFNGLSAIAPGNTTLLVMRLLAGLPHGAFFGVGSVVASRLAEKGKEARAISMMFAGLTFANLLVVPLGTFVGHHYSWRYTFGIVTAIGVITIIFLQLWMPAIPVSRSGNFKSELRVFQRWEPWLILLTTAIGTGGLFAWISYIAPLMTSVSHFSPNTVSYIMILAGLGMVVGNVVGGKLADKMEPVKACMILLACMSMVLVLIFFFSGIQFISLCLTFMAAALSIALATPIQLLMIRTATGGELIAAAATQAAFNVGNALGAFFGGLPILAGFGYNSPSLVGAGMALVGIFFAARLARRNHISSTMTVSKAMPLALLLIAALFPAALQAQSDAQTIYGLKTVNTLEEYKNLIAADPRQEIVNLKTAIPGINLDIRYATANNLMHRPVYHTAAAFLRLPAAQALLAVQQELQPMGYALKIYDGYRPYRVIVAFYEAYHDTNFVASPYTGSRHNRGCAIDLTLIDLKTGKELVMPTQYDAMTKQASAAWTQGLSDEALKNRKLLQDVMQRHGFLILPTEWWHFDFAGWKNYPVTDITSKIF